MAHRLFWGRRVYTLGWCRGPESNWLRPPFQGGALPVSYPGTLESVNFRGAPKLCQIPAPPLPTQQEMEIQKRNSEHATCAGRRSLAARTQSSERASDRRETP